MDGSGLSNEEIARYGRQMLLEPLGRPGQERLKAAAVLVVGAGGLGCACCAYLCAAGVGTLGVVDHDVVDTSNLHRQVLHGDASVGRSKAASAAATLRGLNAHVRVVEHPLALDASNALEVLRAYSVIVDATDNVPTRYLLNDACVVLGLPLVSGSALGMQGQLTLYNLPPAPCYRCLHPVPPPRETVVSCSDGGVLGPIVGVIGSMQALETIKLVAGTELSSLLAGRMLVFDGLHFTSRVARLRGRQPGCFCASSPTALPQQSYEQFCGGLALHDVAVTHEVPETASLAQFCIDAPQLHAWLQDSSRRVVLVDVRSRVQFGICSLPGSHNVPLRELTAQALAHVVGDAPCVVFVCRRGVDSLQALQLHAPGAGARFYHLRGGLQSWARNVDSSFPVY